ncbi:MAG: ABC transporter permease [Nitrospirota bacterium]
MRYWQQSFERIKQIIIKEFIQAFRDKKLRFLLFGPPIIQLFLFGYAVTVDVHNILTTVLDLDRSKESRELIQKLDASGYFTITHTAASVEEIRDLLDRGEVICAVQINRGFGKDIEKGISTEVQVIVDGTYSNTALIAQGYANRIIGAYARKQMRQNTAGGATIDLRSTSWYNPDLKSRNYFVPGVIATVILIIALMLTSMAVVREREVGTMEQLMVTPIKPLELMLGKTIPFAVIGFIDMFLITLIGIFWFGVPIRGSLLILLAGTGIYLLSVLGTGLLISTVSKTQQQALMASMLFIMPAILLSGFAFPIESMPEIFQYVTYINPLRYFLIIIRGVFLKGIGLDILWSQMVILFLLGFVVMALSVARFKKRLR